MRDFDGMSNAELLVCVRRDPAAFGVFYTRYARELLGWFRRRVDDDEVAVELMMETFARALAGVSGFRDQAGGSGGPWLYGIGQHLLADYWRRRRVQTRARERLGISLDMEATGDSQEEADRRLDASIRRGWLRRAVGVLSTAQRQTLRLRFIDGKAYTDIGRELGVSEVAARNRVARAIRQLRDQREDGGDTDD